MEKWRGKDHKNLLTILSSLGALTFITTRNSPFQEQVALLDICSKTVKFSFKYFECFFNFRIFFKNT